MCWTWTYKMCSLIWFWEYSNISASRCNQSTTRWSVCQIEKSEHSWQHEKLSTAVSTLGCCFYLNRLYVRYTHSTESQVFEVTSRSKHTTLHSVDLLKQMSRDNTCWYLAFIVPNLTWPPQTRHHYVTHVSETCQSRFWSRGRIVNFPHCLLHIPKSSCCL